MTDKEALLAMFERAGIPVEHGTGPGDDTGIEVLVPAGRGAGGPVIGYSGFSASFHFSDTGVLKRIGVWE